MGSEMCIRDRYMPEGTHSDALNGLGRVVKERRTDVLRKAALLGVEYLGAHKLIVDEINALETMETT